MKRKITRLIIHCTATPDGREHTIDDITRWHKARGFNEIGYHYVIYIDGSLRLGRALDKMGAHTLNLNANSIGLCYVGGTDNRQLPKDTRNTLQLRTMAEFVHDTIKTYPDIIVSGHNQHANKACPSFDVPTWLRSIGVSERNIEQ